MAEDNCEDGAKTKNYFNLSFIQSELKKMYNIEIPKGTNAANTNDTLNIGGMCYYYENENYVMCGGGQNTDTYVSYVYDHNLEEKKLTIFEIKALLITEGDKNYLLDKFSKTQKEIKIISNKASLEAQKYLKKHKKEFTKYKHTFIKINDEYCWSKTEVVKI